VHPLEGVHLLLSAAKVMQAAVPDAVIMNGGLSWLRQFAAKCCCWLHRARLDETRRVLAARQLPIPVLQRKF